jgi:hypothetical protein
VSRPIRLIVRKRKRWNRPTKEERDEHVRTLLRLGELVIDRTGPIAVWFVLMSGFDELSVSQLIERAG